MSNELNTLLTALYVFVDDHVVPPRTGRGRRPVLSDSELITLAVAQVLLGFDSERRWIRHLHSHPAWRAMFPYLPGQSGYHKRLKNAEPLLCKAVRALAAACPSWFDDLWMTDATPVPCGASRETVKRSDLAGHAGYGYCASHSRYYWGLKLYLVCAGDGMPIMWCLANPKIGEREVVAVLLEHNHHLVRAGQVLLADRGFAGKKFKQLTARMGIRLLRPGEPTAMRDFAGAENALTRTVGQLFVVSEGYPELKANEHMTQLSEELTSAEDRVPLARQQYNDAVLDYNNRREAIPAALFAGMFRFRPAAFFETDSPEERQVRRVSFQASASSGR